MPADNATRVVKGARHLPPALGERMMAARLQDRSVFLRELMPQDLKLEIGQLSQDEAVSAARYRAGVVGKAQATQMDFGTRWNQKKPSSRLDLSISAMIFFATSCSTAVSWCIAMSFAASRNARKGNFLFDSHLNVERRANVGSHCLPPIW